MFKLLSLSEEGCIKHLCESRVIIIYDITLLLSIWCLVQKLRLTKIHRVLKFHQSLWLKIYIDLNTELKKAVLDLEYFFFIDELYFFSIVFGKTMENVKKKE